MTLRKMLLAIMVRVSMAFFVMLRVVMMSIVILGVAIFICYAVCCSAKYRYAECRDSNRKCQFDSLRL
jgi:hypothetical protein